MKKRHEFDILIIILLGIVLTATVALLGVMSNYQDTPTQEACTHTHKASVRLFDHGRETRIEETHCDTYVIEHCIDWLGKFCTAYN